MGLRSSGSLLPAGKKCLDGVMRDLGTPVNGGGYKQPSGSLGETQRRLERIACNDSGGKSAREHVPCPMRAHDPD